MEFSFGGWSQTKILYRDLILRSLFLDFMEVHFSCITNVCIIDHLEFVDESPFGCEIFGNLLCSSR